MQKKIALAIALALSTSAFAEDLTPTFSVTQSGGSGVGTDPIHFSYRTGEVTGVTQLDPSKSYDGFDLSFDYSTHWLSSGMQASTDTLNYWFGGYGSNGYTLFDSNSWSLNGSNGTSGSYNYLYSGDTSGLTSLELKFSGMDGGYWAGMYGPVVKNVALTSATGTAPPPTATPEPEPTNTSDGYCSPTDTNDPDCSTSYNTASTSDTSSDPLANIVPDSVIESISSSSTEDTSSTVSYDTSTVSEPTETVAQTTGQDTGIDDGQDTGTEEVASTGEPEQTNDGSTQTVAESTGEPEPEAAIEEKVAEEAKEDTAEEASGGTVASPVGVPTIAGAPSVSDIVGNSMDFRSSSEKRASSFLNSVGVNTGAWTGTESNTYGVSFQNGVAGGGVGNQTFGVPSVDSTDVAFDAGAPVSGIPSIIDSPIMDVSNQSSMNNDGSVVLAQNTYGNSQDFSRVFDVKAKEAVPTTVVPGNNSLGQDGMAENLSVSDLGGIDINTFKQNNMPDNSNWYSDQNRLQQNSIYDNQDFYESKEIYNNTGWYK